MEQKMTTTLTQASQQWMSRPADERFVSLLDMQAFKRRLRDRSTPQALSSRDLDVYPTESNPRALLIQGPDKALHAPTHWSFGQLCSLASPGNSPASYFRDTNMAAPMVTDCLNYNLRFTRGVEAIGILTTEGDDFSELRSVNGPNYGRIWDVDLVDELVMHFGDGRTCQWRVPGEFGNEVTITKDNTTLFASDRDMFVFLADEKNRIEIPNRRAGRFGSFARGVFVWNSEVGKSSLGAGFFLFDYVCCNRIVWGEDQYTEVRIRHTSGAPHRWLEEVTPSWQSMPRRVSSRSCRRSPTPVKSVWATSSTPFSPTASAGAWSQPSRRSMKPKRGGQSRPCGTSPSPPRRMLVRSRTPTSGSRSNAPPATC
jgi:hypothetical protein